MSAPRKVHVGDHGGNILQMNDSVNGNWTYTYDGFNRLSTANNSNQQAFSYGPKGDSLNCAIFFLRVEWPADAETRSLCTARSCQPRNPTRGGPPDHIFR